MPFAVLVLGASIFVLGTSEIMLTGLLPEIAADLGVSIPDAGLLISAFAAGMLVGAPLLAALTLRLPRRTTLLAMLAVFLLSHLAGALAADYGVLFATRVISAVAAAGFWAVAAVATLDLVPADRRGRAMAVLVGGLTVATVAGVPAGTWLGQLAGWRAPFWTLAVLSAVAMVAVRLLVPATPVPAQAPSLRRELRSYRNPRLWLALGITSFSIAMSLATFSYLAPLLTEESGVPAGWVPVALAVYGAGSLLGITIGGRLADRNPLRTIAGGVAGSIVWLIVLALAGTTPLVAIVVVFLLGVTTFLINPSLNVRMFALAEDAPTLAGASNVSAFNAGILAAPALGGVALSAGYGYLSVPWVSVALGLVALLGVALAARTPAPVPATVAA